MLIDANTLANALQGDERMQKWRLFDCRFNLTDKQAGQRAYLEGHLPGALFADLETDLSAPISPASGRHPLPEEAMFERLLGKWGLTPDHHVVVYDDCGGVIALRLWWMLRWAGHKRASLLDGGIAAWREAGFTLSRSIPTPEPTHYPASFDRNAWVTSDELAVATRQGRCVLLDARSPERFNGEVEPIDSVAGHVPGAVNLPFNGNLNDRGYILPVDELRIRFEKRLGSEFSPQTAIHMCGSGVTACHNLFSMELAGFKAGRLYPGSWSEWIRDPQRAVERA